MSLPQIQIGDGILGNALLSSVDVVQSLNQHWWCMVTCRNADDQRVPVESLLGQSVEVKTSDSDGGEHLHFSGFVYEVELEYEVWGSYTAKLTCVSHSYKLDVTARKQYYRDQTLSSVAGTVAGRDGVAVSVNVSASKPLNYVQYGETDFSFLHRIVDDYGAWLRPCEGGLEVYDSFQAGSTVQWREKSDLVSFKLRGAMAPGNFGGAHYDHHVSQSNVFTNISKAPQFYDGGQNLSGSVQAAAQKMPPGFEPNRARAMTLDDYSQQLQSESERSVGSAVSGSGQSRNQTLMAGNTLVVEGALDAKGTYGLTHVTHQWTPQGYTNSFICTPWKSFRNPRAPAPNMWHGVVSARVTGHDDPKNMGRIQVQFFWQEDGSTHWARATSPHAGPSRGFMFKPEVGDEVAVAFEDGDPERPIILGSHYNGVQTIPVVSSFTAGQIADNDLKQIVTKSGNRLYFGDTPGTESAVLATPNHTSLVMTEKQDQTGRSCIHLHSDGDIILTAPNGRVHVQSLFFSREVGNPAQTTPMAKVGPAPPAPAKEGKA